MFAFYFGQRSGCDLLGDFPPRGARGTRVCQSLARERFRDNLIASVPVWASDISMAQ
jgi:hypothetical protein